MVVLFGEDEGGDDEGDVGGLSSGDGGGVVMVKVMVEVKMVVENSREDGDEKG